MCRGESLMLDIIKTLLEHPVLAVLIVPEVLKQQKMASRLPRPKAKQQRIKLCLDP